MSKKLNDDDKDIQQIQANLVATRESMTATVNELAARLNPSALAGDAKEQVKAKASHAAETVKGVVSDAKRGDRRALAIVGGTAAAAVGVLALKFARRRRRRAKKRV